ncbi:hypothetical protein M422DRAFT_247004 [Sphaerobolus stellatus SS14]|nr:hypothetical protein M422DRAFT_247004 [Sphaerobolus stellatus SS14]
MRFGISRSPSPVRRSPKPRGKFSFGLSAYDSSDEEDSAFEVIEPQSPSDSPYYDSEHDEPAHSLSANRLKRSVQEQRVIEDNLESLRRTNNYQDPFGKWAKETRTAAFRAATKRYETNPASTAAARRLETELRERRVQESHDQQLEEVTAFLQNMNLRRKEEEARLIADYQQREKLLWQRVDGVIKAEEDKVRKQQEEEEKARREEAERKRKEEERRKAEEEKKKAEEKEKALQEELRRKQKEKEDAEVKQREEEDAKLVDARKRIGYQTAKEDWAQARKTLEMVKRNYVPAIKADDNLRPIYSKARRFITPKIGQLTNTQSEIERISTAILQVVLVQPPHPESLYFAILSSLAKAILKQAETEVSARAVTAIPLAQVTIRLLTNVEHFSDVLYARMVQRTGGLAVPIPVPKPQGMGEVEYMKLRGYRTERELQKDFDMRISGIMTLYFAILTSEVSTPMPPMWSFPRYWAYFARLMSAPVLLRSDITTQIIAVALEVGGTRAKQAWGIQFIKVLALLHRSIQETDLSPPGAPIIAHQLGSEGAEGRPGRVRVILEIEKVMAAT